MAELDAMQTRLSNGAARLSERGDSGAPAPRRRSPGRRRNQSPSRQLEPELSCERHSLWQPRGVRLPRKCFRLNLRTRDRETQQLPLAYRQQTLDLGIDHAQRRTVEAAPFQVARTTRRPARIHSPALAGKAVDANAELAPLQPIALLPCVSTR